MGQESAESALFRVLGITREDNHPRHQQSSGSSLALEEDSALATFGAALQQLVSPTAGTRAETAESSDLPAELASIAASTPPVIGREISTLPFNNRQRCIKATGPYELRCEVLDNRQGKIIIEGPLSIYCAHLNSDHGVITATGPITILCGELDNQEGQISSHQGTIRITSRHALQNRQGKIAAQSGITLDNAQKTLNNSHGSISTPGQLRIHSGELDNPGGALLAKDGITILLDTGSIRGAGKIHAGDELQISLQSEQATELHGVLQADSEAQITAQGVVKNHSQISGKEITIEGPSIENAAEGSICSQGDTEILTGASQEGYFNNRGVVDGTTTEICSYHLSNLGGGTICGDQLLLGTRILTNNSEQASPDTKAIISSRQHLTVIAQHIVNQERALISSAGTMRVGEPLDGQKRYRKTVSLSNHSATIEAQGPAEFNIVTLNNEAGSTIHSEQQLTLNSDNIQGLGSISSAGDLQITLTGEQPKKLTGPLQAQGNLSLTAPGELNNHAPLQAGQQLQLNIGSEFNNFDTLQASQKITLQAHAMLNHATGVLQAPQIRIKDNVVCNTAGTIINTPFSGSRTGEHASGTLNNRGLINSQNIEVRFLTLNNIGSGQLYGDQIAIAGYALNNYPECVSGKTATPVLGARQHLAVGAHLINNREHALLFSLGSMSVGQNLNTQHQLTGTAVELNNDSATIDVHGDANFNITTLNNRDLHFNTKEAQVSAKFFQQYLRDD